MSIDKSAARLGARDFTKALWGVKSRFDKFSLIPEHFDSQVSQLIRSIFDEQQINQNRKLNQSLLLSTDVTVLSTLLIDDLSAKPKLLEALTLK